jgi:hypothetical protein
MSQSRKWAKPFVWIGLVAALLAALWVSGALSGFGSGVKPPPVDRPALRAARDAHLLPIRTLLDENGEISSDLRRRFVEYPGGIQESYHAKLMRDGADKHREMKDRIERLNRNNLSILAHLNAYGEPRTPELKEQVAFFREHALRYDERWKALPDAAARQVELPVAQPMFPPGFPRAIGTEIAAVDAALSAR